MYRQFDLSSITTNLILKQIAIEMTAGIDPKSISGEDLRVFDCTANNYVTFAYAVAGSNLTLTLNDYPRSNSRYIVILQEITNIVGEKLARGIHHSIVFKSAINTKVKIISPVFSEKITDLNLILDEYLAEGETGELVNSFCVEIALDNLFQNIIKTISLTSSQAHIDIAPGQYYIRVRAQTDFEYGRWSDVSTFVIYEGSESEGSSDPENTNEAIYTSYIDIVDTPVISNSLGAIIIEFNDFIDPSSTENIIVTRRVI